MIPNDSQENSTKYYDRLRWKTIKDITDTKRQKPPRLILIDNKMTTSLSKICNHANQFFINKVKKLRDNFKSNFNTSPIEILNYLLKRNTNSFQFKTISNNGVKNLIKKAKATNSLGNDLISMKTIKKLGPVIVPYITKLINTIIITQKYPEIFKVSRITPFLKNDKPSFILSN